MYQTSHYTPLSLESVVVSYNSVSYNPPTQAFYSMSASLQQPYASTPNFASHVQIPSHLSLSSTSPLNLSSPLSSPSFPSLSSYNHHSNSYSIPTQVYQLFTPHREYHFQPDHFLKPRKNAIFVKEANQIRPHIEEAFTKIFNQSFPNDVAITILNKDEFRKIAPHPSTVGVSFNRKKHGLLSEIFVLNDTLGRVMLTLGHELGHVLTETLENPTLEEAKAYSFSFLWMEIIKKHNIANLGNSVILENPAENGLHDKAFEFVMKKKKTRTYYQIYIELLRSFKYQNMFFN